MALITDDYREQNRLLHDKSWKYGSKGWRNAAIVRDLMHRYGATTVLDYGCGKAGLASKLGSIVRNYDPAIEKYSAAPSPADIVVCADVLEHVEPECLDDVLRHLSSLTLKAALLQIACRSAQEHLPDGRNTHQIVESPEWWMDRLLPHFTLTRFALDDDCEVVAFVCEPPT